MCYSILQTLNATTVISKSTEKRKKKPSTEVHGETSVSYPVCVRFKAKLEIQLQVSTAVEVMKTTSLSSGFSLSCSVAYNLFLTVYHSWYFPVLIAVAFDVC